MTSIQIHAGLKRFARGFVAGGVGAMAVLAQSGITFSDFTEMKTVGFVLLSAFITGGIIGLDKVFRWKE